MATEREDWECPSRWAHGILAVAQVAPGLAVRDLTNEGPSIYLHLAIMSIREYSVSIYLGLDKKS